jgi:hypothetical protein
LVVSVVLSFAMLAALPLVVHEHQSAAPTVFNEECWLSRLSAVPPAATPTEIGGLSSWPLLTVSIAPGESPPPLVHAFACFASRAPPTGS